MSVGTNGSDNGRKRVVITGLGLVSSLGNSVDESWRALCAGESGSGEITLFDSTGLAIQDLAIAVAALSAAGCRHTHKEVEPRRSIEELTQEAQSADKSDRCQAVLEAGDQAPDNKHALPLLIAALSAKDPDVRWAGTKGLKQFGAAADEATPRLTELLRDPNPTVRAGSARAGETADRCR